MPHTVTKITFNPQVSKIYIHTISPTEQTIELVGEDTVITSVREKALLPNGQANNATSRVTATL